MSQGVVPAQNVQAIGEIIGELHRRQAQGAGAGQWVRAAQLDVSEDTRRGLGARLAALERVGLVESQCMNQSWDLRRRYDVTWRLTEDGRRLLGGTRA